jgi:hypothetical protein
MSQRTALHWPVWLSLWLVTSSLMAWRLHDRLMLVILALALVATWGSWLGEGRR